MSKEWWESESNLVELASLLVDDGMTAREVIGFFEQPRKWGREWEFRERHDGSVCCGLLNCEIQRCEGCLEDLPECQLVTVECRDSDYALCESCRALPEFAPAPEWSEETATP